MKNCCKLAEIQLLGDSTDEDEECENGIDESIEEENDEETENDSDENESDDDETEDIVLNRDYEVEQPGIKSGSTGVVAILKGNQLYVANVGDSRCVVCREGEFRVANFSIYK